MWLIMGIFMDQHLHDPSSSTEMTQQRTCIVHSSPTQHRCFLQICNYRCYSQPSQSYPCHCTFDWSQSKPSVAWCTIQETRLLGLPGICSPFHNLLTFYLGWNNRSWNCVQNVHVLHSTLLTPVAKHTVKARRPTAVTCNTRAPTIKTFIHALSNFQVQKSQARSWRSRLLAL